MFGVQNNQVTGPVTTSVVPDCRAIPAYRITRVAAAGIINKNRRACLDLRLFEEGDPIDLAIAASLASPWDMSLAAAIPEKLKGYVCIYLEAAGTPIDGWYQGNRARDAMPAAKVRGARAIFKRYLEITNDTEAALRATDVAEMTSGPLH